MSGGFIALLRAIVVRPMTRDKARTALTIAGIAVGVAVLVAIQLSNRSAMSSFRSSVDAIAGKANYQIVSDVAPIDENFLLRLQPLWQNGGRFAPVIDIDAAVEPNGVPIRILGVDLLSDLHFRDYRYARIITSEGAQRDVGGSRAPGSSDLTEFLQLFREDSIVVPEVIANEYHTGLGRPLVLSAGDRTVRFVVRGILKPQGAATAFNGSIAILDIGTAQRAFGMEGHITRVDLLVPESSTAFLAQLARDLPPGARLERPARRNDRVEKMLRAFRVNLFALAAVALLVGVFLVYNTVLISVLRRWRDIGIAKTLGASAREITLVFAAEGAILGFVGSLLGVLLGWLLAFGASDLIGRTINSLYVETGRGEIVVTPMLALAAIAIGTGVSVVAALQPAIEASAAHPTELIRPGVYQRLTRSRLGRLAAAAAACLVIAALLTRLPAIHGLAIAGYASVVFVVAGFSLLAPAVIVSVAAAARGTFRRLSPVAGDLAAVSVPASLRRVAVATAALATAIGMMVAVAIMVGSFRETVRVWVAQTVQSDLWLRPARGLSNASVSTFPERISDDLARIRWVAAYDRFRGRNMVIGDSIINVGSGDFDVAIRFGDLPMVAPNDPRTALRSAIDRGGVIVSESFSLKFNRGVGGFVEIPTLRGTRRLPITGVYRDYSNDRGVIVMDRALYKSLFGDSSINTVAIFLKKGVDPEWARGEFERLLGKKYRVFAATNASIRHEVMRIFDQTFLITYALLVISILVAVLGIVNTLSALILERRREIALLRILGVTRRELTSMVVLESSLIATTSAILGAVSGWVLAWILIFVINKQSFGWTIELHPPLRLVVLSLFVTFAATTLAGVIPARLAARLVAATEIKSE